MDRWCIVVMVLDLELKIAGSIPASGLSSATFCKLLNILLPLSTGSIIWYKRKLGSKQAHRATH